MEILNTPPKKVNKVDALLALRGLACLAVVMFHNIIPRKILIYQNYDFTWLFVSDGIIAVWIFFCLSGYLMGKAFYTQRYTTDISGVKQFILNRALRICPLYYFSALILCIFVYPNALRMENWGDLTRICLFLTAFPIPMFSNLDWFNPVIWSLSTEVQFYLIVPFIYSIFKPILVTNRKIIITTFLLLIISFLIRCAAFVTHPFHTALLLNLDVFLWGFFVNAWFDIQKNNQKKFNAIAAPQNPKKLKIIAIIIGIIFYLVTAHHGYHNEMWNYPPPRPGMLGSTFFRTVLGYYIWPVLTAIITSFFIYAFESEEMQSNDLVKNQKLSGKACRDNPGRLLEIMGVLSYGVYLWHFPIRDQVMKILSIKNPFDISFELYAKNLLITLFFSIILSTVTYYLVELPATQYKKYSEH
jgi:peptidoglycan/LPS O-acetylase OafA/YrhL